MKTLLSKTIFAVLTMLLLCAMAQSASAQNVEARISTREAYVGMPVVLQLAIQNASDYEQPTTPEIDGCDIRSAGAPSQSSQITIMNGRRSESRSVTIQYLITPRRAGSYEIPSMTVNVNGRDQKTQPLQFVATKSETGDLLFVEIEGGKDKVFVGQSLNLTLKIWIKPFADRQNQIKLSEANMWQMITEQTSWGSFSERLQELAQNNQRPGGQEVVRDNGQGGESAYYLYEIEATVYPKRPGKIDADDVQIVVNYPTGIGQSRDPFESMLGGGGISSRMQQMMGDDFFGSAFGGSPFGNRLSITSSRPIVGQASVDTTEVVSVPTAGRPANYRGAVGRYKIVTQATPTAVSAGDPITLNIGIAGTGPMELVQAPPLTDFSSLTSDFKVADQSLAGFVQDETKVFSTTIRPRREGITTIPPIPFSFFDPDAEKFETVMSEPISITVDKSESLALDAIVGNARRDRSTGSTSESNVTTSLEPNFENNNSASVLDSQPPATSSNWWWTFVVIPPVVWLTTLLVRKRASILAYAAGWEGGFRSAHAKTLSAIDRAKTREQIENALVRYIGRRTQTTLPTRSVSESISPNALASGSISSITTRCKNEGSIAAVGALRKSGMYSIASEVESFCQRNEHSAFSGASEISLAQIQSSARELVETLEGAFGSMTKTQVRHSRRRGRPASSIGNSKPNVRRATQQTSMLLIAGLLAFSAAGNAFADDVTSLGNRSKESSATSLGNRSYELTDAQRETIFAEASDVYTKAAAIAKSDSAEANDLFSTAAAKYQLLVDAGVHNSHLFMNLGNAYLQSNRIGHAIVSYERAKLLDPTNRQLQSNLDFATSLVKGQHDSIAISGSPSSETSTGTTSLDSVIINLRNANHSFTRLIGTSNIIWTLALSSFVFWGLLTSSALGYRFPVKRLAIVPLLILMLSATSYCLSSTAAVNDFDGVIVVANVTLHAGDGEQFEEVTTLDTAQGHRVQILHQRGDWVQVRTTAGHIGWMKQRDVQSVI